MILSRKITFKVLFTFLILLFFTACSSIHTIKYANIKELHTLPQRAYEYVKDINQTSSLYKIQHRYNVSYFRPWNLSYIKTSLYNIQWPFRNYTIFNSYGVNLKPLKLFWFYHQYANSNYQDYATINKHAITLHYASLHNFPTNTPIFKNPTRAGEGFPFNYNQHSGVDGDKPVIVSHYSRDKAWVYIFTSFASGWLSSSDIVYVNNKDINMYKSKQFIHVLQDSYPIIDENGKFICYTRIGMMLPLVQIVKNNYKVLIATKDKNNSVIFRNVLISKQIATTKTLKFTKKNIIKITNAIIHSKYGWGGIGAQRDCSSFVRDFYAPFGIWLPRNSASEARIGKIISLRHLTNKEKILIIKKHGVPFQTLLYMRGHIVIYAGVYHDRVIVLQDMWGIDIKNGHKTGRIIVGRTVFTTLNIGNHQKYYNSNGSALNRIISMNIITK